MHGVLPDIRRQSSLLYVPGLDGMRAIAVSIVMAFHFTAWYAPALAPLGTGWDLWTRVAKLGWMGVDIFFVLSGFLITRVLEERPLHGLRDYGRFLARRAWRLLPAYVACLLVFNAVALGLAPEAKTLRTQWMLWTFTSNLWPAFGDRGALVDPFFAFAHFWSLSAEWHFYLLFPWLLRAMRTDQRAGLALIAVALLTRMAIWSTGLSDNATYAFTFSRVDGFGMGCLVAAYRGELTQGARRLALAVATALIGVIAVSLMLTPLSFKGLAWMQLCGYTGIAAAAALFLHAIVHGPREGLLVRALEWRPLVAWGRVSYSAYLWHLVYLPGLAMLVARHVDDVRAQYACTALLATASTVAMAFLSYRFVEARFLGKRPAAPAIA